MVERGTKDGGMTRSIPLLYMVPRRTVELLAFRHASFLRLIVKESCAGTDLWLCRPEVGGTEAFR